MRAPLVRLVGEAGVRGASPPIRSPFPGSPGSYGWGGVTVPHGLRAAGESAVREWYGNR